MLRRDMNYIGVREGGPPASVAEHFHTCPACGQAVDRRDLAAVFYHEGPGHEPLPLEEAYRLVLADEKLGATLRKQPD